jgi:hypothetical protein
MISVKISLMVMKRAVQAALSPQALGAITFVDDMIQ